MTNPPDPKTKTPSQKGERTITIYRDDSTTQVVYDRVKHFFWTAGNTTLVIARLRESGKPEHYYIHWPRERFCWFKDEPNKGGK